MNGFGCQMTEHSFPSKKYLKLQVHSLASLRRYVIYKASQTWRALRKLKLRGGRRG